MSFTFSFIISPSSRYWFQKLLPLSSKSSLNHCPHSSVIYISICIFKKIMQMNLSIIVFFHFLIAQNLELASKQGSSGRLEIEDSFLLGVRWRRGMIPLLWNLLFLSQLHLGFSLCTQHVYGICMYFLWFWPVSSCHGPMNAGHLCASFQMADNVTFLWHCRHLPDFQVWVVWCWILNGLAATGVHDLFFLFSLFKFLW